MIYGSYTEQLGWRRSRRPFFAGLHAAAAFAAALVLAPTGAHAEESWGQSCDAGQCQISTNIRQADTNQRIMTAFATVSADGQQIGFALPLGVSLAPGVKMIVTTDGTAQEYDLPFAVCLPDGCSAGLQVEPDVLDALAAADSVEVRHFAWASPNLLAIPVPMTGFADGLAAARSELGL